MQSVLIPTVRCVPFARFLEELIARLIALTKAQGDAIDEKVSVSAGRLVVEILDSDCLFFAGELRLRAALSDGIDKKKKSFCSVHYVWMLHNAVVGVKPKASQQGCVVMILIVKAAIALKL